MSDGVKLDDEAALKELRILKEQKDEEVCVRVWKRIRQSLIQIINRHRVEMFVPLFEVQMIRNQMTKFLHTHERILCPGMAMTVDLVVLVCDALFYAKVEEVHCNVLVSISEKMLRLRT